MVFRLSIRVLSCYKRIMPLVIVLPNYPAGNLGKYKGITLLSDLLILFNR